MQLALAALLFSIFLYSFRRRKDVDTLKIPTRRSFWYMGTPEFFADPFNFIIESMKWANGSIFSFKVLSSTVVVLRGIPGRDAFFSKGMDFMSGYRLLNPQLVDVMPVTEISGDESWASFMANFIRSDVLAQLYPTMIQDVSRLICAWGDKGEIDPFENVYELVFALSVRLATCREFCDDPKMIKRLMEIFKRLEAGSTPTSIIFPWVPTLARIGRLLAGGELYKIINDVVQSRKSEGRQEEDPLQVLIDKNFSLVDITRFIAMTLFAAITNTGNVLCWVLIYLEANPTWKTKVTDEINDFVQTIRSDSTSHSLASSLALVSIEEMDEHTPSLDLCINETLRMIFIGTFMRRNIGEDIFVSGVRIKRGTFLMYPTADLHFDPSIYPEPELFDPTRFTSLAIEDRREHGISFLGWGAARHVCVGKRAATLMMKIIAILITTTFDTGIVNPEGKPIRVVPPAHHNMLFKVCPPGSKDRVLLKYHRRLQL